jgi:hypothetical protein
MQLRQAADDRLPKTEIATMWFVVAIAVGAVFWNKLDEAMVSTDNVMRLVEVRALLNGAPWFDPHEARFAPPWGYDTHWSRLIDGGLAGLIVSFRQVMAPDLAERLTRCVWPLLMAGPAVAAVAAMAVRLGGAGAGRAALLISLPTTVLLSIFRPGEIDHHNAQVMLALVMCACAMWCERPLCATAAGIAGGALLTVGLEAAHVLIAVAATLALLAVHDGAFAQPARRFAVALGATTLVGYALVTPNAVRWVPQCDALAVNSLAAVVFGAAGLTLVGSLSDRSVKTRLVLLGLFGLLSLALFAAIEPRCLRGPFGLIDRSVFALWLDKVQEMQSLAQLFRAEGIEVLVYLAFPLVAAISIIAVARSGLHTPVAWAVCVAFVVSFIIMVSQIRMIIYVIWLGLPFVGVAAQFLAERTPRIVLVRTLAATLGSPAVVSLVAMDLTDRGAPTREHVEADKAIATCFKPEAFKTLAALPAGLVLGPLDLGPAILANTPHSIVAAPYHRADKAIRFNQELMDGPAAVDPARLVGRGINYVVTCTAYAGHVKSQSLHAALLAGRVEGWLRPLPTADGDIIKIWQVLGQARAGG